MDAKRATVFQGNDNINLSVIIHISGNPILHCARVIIGYLYGRDLFTSSFILPLFERNTQWGVKAQNGPADADVIYELTRLRIRNASISKARNGYNGSDLIP